MESHGLPDYNTDVEAGLDASHRILWRKGRLNESRNRPIGISANDFKLGYHRLFNTSVSRLKNEEIELVSPSRSKFQTTVPCANAPPNAWSTKPFGCSDGLHQPVSIGLLVDRAPKRTGTLWAGE